MTRTTTRSRIGVATAALTALALTGFPVQASAEGPASAAARVDPGLQADGAGAVRVIVRVRPGAGEAPVRALTRLGGQVTADLPIISGFAATLPRTAVDQLAGVDGVEVISANRSLKVQGGTPKGGKVEMAPRVVQAPKAWSAGLSGRGVTVALIDTGVAALPELAGRVAPVQDTLTGTTSSCYDLSGEGNCQDTYGHGTFMAGLIAGGAANGGASIGVAPQARVVSVKVAGADGAADVSTVLAGIQWVVSFREKYGIRILNLSLGTDSTQSWRDDPLNYAVERAWDSGVLVMVAAANNGPRSGTIAKPGDDPYVVTVGAVDSKGTPGIGDDSVPNFSSRGPTAEGIAKPDLVAPGAHVLSLRSPGSTLERLFPTPNNGGPYRTGSGTSMATAIASGAAALVVEAHPTLAPNRLKHALTSAARRIASDDPSAVGAGLIDAYRTAEAPAVGAANSGLPRSSGRGELGLSRGSLQIRTGDPLRTVMTGRQTAQLLLWDPAGMTGQWTADTWFTSVNATAGWNTAYWMGGETFNGQNWTGQNWTGQNWTGSSFYSHSEEGSAYGRPGPGSASYGAWD